MNVTADVMGMDAETLAELLASAEGQVKFGAVLTAIDELDTVEALDVMFYLDQLGVEYPGPDEVSTPHASLKELATTDPYAILLAADAANRQPLLAQLV